MYTYSSAYRMLQNKNISIFLERFFGDNIQTSEAEFIQLNISPVHQERDQSLVSRESARPGNKSNFLHLLHTSYFFCYSFSPEKLIQRLLRCPVLLLDP